MLNRISNTVCMEPVPNQRTNEDKWQRNEKDDLKTAIEYLYEFKDRLSKLHPLVIDIIENMLQRPRY